MLSAIRSFFLFTIKFHFVSCMLNYMTMVTEYGKVVFFPSIYCGKYTNDYKQPLQNHHIHDNDCIILEVFIVTRCTFNRPLHDFQIHLIFKWISKSAFQLDYKWKKIKLWYWISYKLRIEICLYFFLHLFQWHSTRSILNMVTSYSFGLKCYHFWLNNFNVYCFHSKSSNLELTNKWVG